ncbi:MAG TPA: retention module-containing protein, partial [Methylotenera sp.]|nr:retention module-containing protein [Methylotenera sp.]
MALIGKVVAMTGVAYLITDNGTKRELQLGDQIQTGDTIQTPRGVDVDLELASGRVIHISAEQLVAFTEELSEVIVPGGLDSAINLATIETVIKAIEEGKDINAVLEETAAGANGQLNSYGFGFVDLFRINDILNAFNFSYSIDSDTGINSELLGNDDNNYAFIADSEDASAGLPASNTAPTAVATSGSGTEDAASIMIALSGTDDGTVASITLSTLPTDGTLYTDAALTLPAVTNTAYLGSTATLYFVPNSNFNGNVSFTYTVTDDLGLSDGTPATVSITVNPVTDLTAADDSISVDEDGSIIGASVAGNDSTISGGSLSYALVSGTSNGSLTFNADGSYDYTPATNYNGSDSFDYTVTDADSGESSTHTVSITVDPVV